MYYFYNKLESEDGVRVKPILITPNPTEQQLKYPYWDFCISSEEFEEVIGYSKVIYVNFKDLKIEADYQIDYIEKVQLENLIQIKNDLDCDIRLNELELVLSGFYTSRSFNISKEVLSYARPPYELLKIILESNDYCSEDMKFKVNVYYERYKKITLEQQKELLGIIMEVKE